MGYTHYFTNKKATPAQWEKFTTTVQQLIVKSSAKICDGFGKGSPEITDTFIALNGDGNLSHETFMIDNDNIQRDFCKTARKPYDEVVVAALIYGERVGVIESWDSDGDDKLGEFDEAKKLLDSLS